MRRASGVGRTGIGPAAIAVGALAVAVFTLPAAAQLAPDGIAIDPADGLSPIEAGYLALASNPSLELARADLRLERIALVQAGVLPEPEISASAGLPVAGAGPEDGFAWSLGLAWEVTGGLGRRARFDAATRTGEAVRLDVAWQEWGVFQQTRLAAVDVLGLADLDRQLAEWAPILVSRIDRLQEETALGLLERRWGDEARRKLTDIESRRSSVRADLVAAQSTLHAVMGMPVESEIRLAEGAFSSALPPRDQLLAQLPERRLDLVALGRHVDARAANVREAEISRFPPLSVGVSADSDTTGLLVSSLNVSLPLPLGGQRSNVLDRARDDHQRALDESGARAREAAADVVRLYDACVTWREREAAAESRVDVLTELVAERQADLDLGLATWLEAAQLEDDLRDAQLDLSDIHRQSRRATIELETASGWLFSQADVGHE